MDYEKFKPLVVEVINLYHKTRLSGPVEDFIVSHEYFKHQVDKLLNGDKNDQA